MIIIGPLFLVVIGPGKLPEMARDFGRFVGDAVVTSTSSKPNSPLPRMAVAANRSVTIAPATDQLA